jgi:medium-chain acyl-[acyl-carrier-protein] hydrolase
MLKLATPWLEPSQRKAGARLRLFCFPYAGGSAIAYRDWRDAFPAGIDVCAVQLPGRGQRLLEPAFSNAFALVDAAAATLTPLLDRPFALYGHSMGALIAFELARLWARCGRHAERLFVAASPAPHLNNSRRRCAHLPDPEFIEHLRRLQGTPPELLDDAEAMQLLIPLLRRDFQLVETYEYLPGPPLHCPITAIGGLEDQVLRSQIEDWRSYTPRFSLTMVPGDHFLRREADLAIRRIVLRHLQPVLDRVDERGVVREQVR